MLKLPTGKFFIIIALLLLCVQATGLSASAYSGTAIKQATARPLAAPPPPCYGSTCFKLDPFAKGCGTATWYNSLPHTNAPLRQNFSSGTIIGYIYNYYSSWCNANWAEAVMYNSTGVTISIESNFGEPNEEFQCYPGDNYCPGFYYGQTGYPDWTNMVDGTTLASACANLSIWTLQQVTCTSQ
jgi:hypothetical protein